MEEKQISIKTLVKQTNFSECWLDQILKEPYWNPWLDTVLKILEALSINAVQFVEYAETKKLHNRRYDSVLLTPAKISSTLKAIRLQKGLSQADLAKLTHFQLSSISLRENTRYKSYPTPFTLEVYCKAYDMSVSSFLLLANEIPQNFQEVSL